MGVKENVQLLLDVFRAIELRNDQRFRDLLDPDFELHWPPSLPYGGIARGASPTVPTWSETWTPLPPWWSWSVTRLAAKSGGRLHPIAGGAGPKEKRRIGLALSQATGRPLLADFGRVISPTEGRADPDSGP